SARTELVLDTGESGRGPLRHGTAEVAHRDHERMPGEVGELRGVLVEVGEGEVGDELAHVRRARVGLLGALAQRGAEALVGGGGGGGGEAGSGGGGGGGGGAGGRRGVGGLARLRVHGVREGADWDGGG